MFVLLVIKVRALIVSCCTHSEALTLQQLASSFISKSGKKKKQKTKHPPALHHHHTYTICDAQWEGEVSCWTFLHSAVLVSSRGRVLFTAANYSLSSAPGQACG